MIGEWRNRVILVVFVMGSSTQTRFIAVLISLNADKFRMLNKLLLHSLFSIF